MSGARHATDEMFLAAARDLADQLPQSDLETGRVYPPATRMREVAAAMGEVMATVAYEQSLATTGRPNDLGVTVRSAMYEPRYEAPTRRPAAP